MDEQDQQPEDAVNAVDASHEHALALELFPIRVSIGPTRVLLNWRLNLTNGGASHIVALRVWSDMVSAHSSLASAEQLGGPDMADARLHKISQLDPGARESVVGEWQLPRHAIMPVGNSPDQMILPLARLRCIGAGIAPIRQAFVIGQPPAAGEERLRALQLSGDMQIHTRLSARAVM
ncbi:hypothetical protein [Aurantiacibacter marinus]|uniref:Uncharacterized protein n=1 Tax=Aurantiacibacter marinus TaxID=874156 RepID=A0A0H0XQH2_9SPHN|nr:hypothetical protein [Aurantiacibacter marinus]KLI64197.1 hypothetical protein AAV99_00530 [Aurantiacibacter marinus]